MEKRKMINTRDTDKIILSPEAEGYLQVRYLKLHFFLEILRDGYLPKSKASALRGGMGQMLLMTNCIRDGKCEACDFDDDCLVRRMMYPKMEIRPKFMTRQDSEGYVLECENTHEVFAGGQLLEFNLILLGKTIVYFSQFLQAFHYLGMQGLGKDHVPFRVKRVTNSRGEVIVDGNNVYKEKLEILTLADYVRYRLSRLSSESTASGCVETLVFHSPLALKYKGEIQKSFSPEAVLVSLERRLYILNCFEGRREGDDFQRIDVVGHLPKLVEQRAFTEKIARYSGTQNAKLSFYGIEGYCRLNAVDETARTLLIAGELVHIGKNTSFGFGRYTLVTSADLSHSQNAECRSCQSGSRPDRNWGY